MASELPSPETRQQTFEQGIALALNLWPDLRLAVRDSLGGPDSADKRDWLCGAVADLFPPFAGRGAAAGAADDHLDNAYIQEFLANVLVDEFELVLEEGDPGLWQVAEQIVRIRRDCAAGNFANVEMLRRRWAESQGKNVDALFKKGDDADQDTDWDSEDDGDDDDAEMDEAPPLVHIPKEKPPPEMDEDGFIKVTKKKR